MAKTKAKEIKSTELVILDAFAINKLELEQLVNGYKNLIITEENLKDGKAALQVLRQKRYDIQNQQKANDKSRIEWNTKYMNSNKAKADEYISIISPVEEPIAAKVKEIEDVIQAEKDRAANEKKQAAAARTKLITDTGAVFQDNGYAISDQWISVQEIETLPETSFNKVVAIFESCAKHIAEDKQKQEIIAQQIKMRTDKLYEIGMLRGQDSFVMPFESPTALSDKMLSELNDAIFGEFVESVKIKMNEKAKADKDLKAQQEQFRIDQENLLAERNEIAKQKQALIDQRTESRKQTLIDYGFIVYGLSLKFATISIFDEQIIAATDSEWQQIIADKFKQGDAIKKENERRDAFNKCIDLAKSKGFELKEDSAGKYLVKSSVTISLSLFAENPKDFDELLALAESAISKNEKAKSEALKPDKDKLVDFANTFTKPFQLELKSEEGKKILSDFNLKVIEAVQELIIEVNKK